MTPADVAAISPSLWLVAFQFGLYAIGRMVCTVLLKEDEGTVLHWGLFLLLLSGGLLLAGLRTEPRTWWDFNGANLLTVAAFAVVRRGVDMFFRMPSSDGEQLVMLSVVGVAMALLDTGPAGSAWRILLSCASQGYVMARLIANVCLPARAEFGRTAWLAIVVPGLLIVVLLMLLALRQALSLGALKEMHDRDVAVADVLARADQALYRAQAKGRNRVEAMGF